MRLLTVILFVFTSIATWAGTADIQYFAARVDGQSIVINWTTATEQGVSRFRIERAGTGDDNFTEMATVQASGSNSSYEFRDTHLAANGTGNPPQPSSELYRYRLAIIGSDNGISYSRTITVSRPLSAVTQTWGSIKNMFR